MIKGITKVIFALALIIVSISLIIDMKYDLYINEYLAYSAPLTQEEQTFIKEKKKLVVCVDQEKKPYIFYNEESHKMDGLLAEYIEYIAKELRIDVEYKEIESDTPEEELEKGNVDLIEVLYDSENTEIAFTQSLYNVEGVFITRYDSNIEEYRDLNNKKVAIVEGELIENNISEPLPKGGHTDFIYVDSVREGLEKLTRNQVDAFAGDKLVVDNYSREMRINNQIKTFEGRFYKGDVTFGMNVYDTKLSNIMNKTILKLKKQNIYSDLQEEWLGSASLMGTGSTGVRWAQWIITICVGIVVLLMIWESVLNSRIEQKTKEIDIERKNLQTVIDNIGSVVMVLNKNCDIVTCNRYGKEIIDDQRGSFIGCNITTVPMFNALFQKYKKNPSKTFYSYNGKYYQIQISNIGTRENNFLFMLTDCTEQTIAEQKMRQESKMIAVGQLSAGLAHEIRNPLGLIKTYSYLLKDYSTDEMSEHSLKVIGDSVNRIDNLIENLLSFSRLSNDKPNEFDITKLTENIIELGKKTFEKGNAKVIFRPEKHINVKTIEESIKIIIYNLVNNAVEAFKEAGQSDGQIVISESLIKGILKIQISDNGPGMSEETIENIFNPFFTTKDTGTGLGLYIVITEIKKINGQINVKSTINQGSSFIVEIPISE